MQIILHQVPSKMYSELKTDTRGGNGKRYIRNVTIGGLWAAGVMLCASVYLRRVIGQRIVTRHLKKSESYH